MHIPFIHPHHKGNPSLHVFEKNGKFGVGTTEALVPQFTLNSKAEAEEYIKVAQAEQAAVTEEAKLDAQETADAPKPTGQAPTKPAA